MAKQITSNHFDEEECNIQDFHDVFTMDGIDMDDIDVERALEKIDGMPNEIAEDFFYDSLSDLEDLFLDNDEAQGLPIDNDISAGEKKNQVHWNQVHWNQMTGEEMTTSSGNAHDTATTTNPRDVPLMNQRQAPYSQVAPNQHRTIQSHQQQPVYRDYSTMSDNEALSHLRKSTSLRGKNQESFPMKLHKILNKSETNLHYSSIITWLPHGRAFIINDKTRFISEIMPRYFFQTLWSSFMRQVNVYGFRKLTRDVDRGAYCHELFLRGRPGLCVGMTRSKNKISFDPRTEPNFYDIAFVPSSTVPSASYHGVPHAAANIPSTRTITTAAPSEIRRIQYMQEEQQEQQVKYVAQTAGAAAPTSTAIPQASTTLSSQNPLATIIFGSSRIKVTATTTTTPTLSPSKRSASPDRKPTVKTASTVDKKLRLSHHTLFHTFMMCLFL